MNYPHKQRGFSLFMVMIIMLVIALLVVVSSQTVTTEMRISTNEADRKYAMSLAENGLRTAENYIAQTLLNQTSNTFTYSCDAGLCAPVEEVYYIDKAKSRYKIDDKNKDTYKNTPAHKRIPNSTQDAKSVLEISSTRIQSDKDKGVYFIIEFLGERNSGAGDIINTFRVTVRAEGENPNTLVTLQSYVEMIAPTP